MKITKCDRCGNTCESIKPKALDTYYSVRKIYDGTRLDLCEDCLKKLKTFLESSEE